MSLKILVLTPRIPFPLRDGGAIAMNQTLEGLMNLGYEVSLLAMNTARHWIEESSLPAQYSKLKEFKSVFVNNSINPFSAFLNLFTDKSYNVIRFINKSFESELKNMLAQNNYDIVFFESIYTSPYLNIVKLNSNAVCVCRVHNIEHRIWEKLSVTVSSFLKRRYLKILAERLKTYELDVLKKFDALLPISEDEANELRSLQCKVDFTLPFGVHVLDQKHENQTEENSCYHIGSMDWMPNVEGVEWFVEEVWNDFSVLHSEVKFYIAGKNIPASFYKKFTDNNIEVVGEVDDFVRFTLSKNIMIVPLKSGAGIRIKILEAMALGKTIIATSLAAEGINAKAGRDILIADTKEEFLSSLEACFSEKHFVSTIGANAYKFVNDNYSASEIYSKLGNYLNGLVK